jgi:GNAT superfamily N-acetyltransferase
MTDRGRDRQSISRARRRAADADGNRGRPGVHSRAMKKPSITLRQARPDDMMGCARVFRASANDLARRQGNAIPPIRLQDMASALGHLQRTDPKGFQVAVQGGRVVAFASTILRGNTHFLSMFWAMPKLQSKGVGRRVLARAFEQPRPPKSAVRCVYASLDTRAQSLYLKFGMRPRGMFYLFKGPPKRLPRPRHTVELEQVGSTGKTTPEMLALAARFDRTFRATRRDQDIRYVMSLPGARFFRARAGRSTIGYAIVNEKGRVGPAGVIDPRYGAGLTWAINEAAREMGAENAFYIVPGVNAGALEVLFGAGFKAEFFGAWMSAKPICSFESYFLAGGMLL